MGKDLSIAVPLLYPINKEEYTPLYSSCHILRLNRKDYDKYDRLDQIAQPFNETDDNVYYDYQANLEEGEDPYKDPYGNPFQAIPINQFLEIYEVKNLTLNDKAICAYLKALPQDLPIVLVYS